MWHPALNDVMKATIYTSFVCVWVCVCANCFSPVVRSESVTFIQEQKPLTIVRTPDVCMCKHTHTKPFQHWLVRSTLLSEASIYQQAHQQADRAVFVTSQPPDFIPLTFSGCVLRFDNISFNLSGHLFWIRRGDDHVWPRAQIKNSILKQLTLNSTYKYTAWIKIHNVKAGDVKDSSVTPH